MLKNKVIVTLFGLSVLLLLISAIIGGVGLPESQDLLIIRFSKFAEEANLVGDLRTIFSLGLVASFIILINFLLAWEIYTRERFLSYIIASATLIISFLFLVAVYEMTTIN